MSQRKPQIIKFLESQTWVHLCLPAILVFLFFSSNIVADDKNSFYHSAHLSFLNIALAFGLSCLLCQCIDRYLPSKYIRAFGLGLSGYFIFNDLFYPIALGEMMGTDIRRIPSYEGNLRGLVLEYVLGGFAFFSFYLLYFRLKKWITLIGVSLIFVGLFQLAFYSLHSIYRNLDYGNPNKTFSFPIKANDSVPIFVILMDGMEARDGLREIRKQESFYSSLQGFTVFPFAISPYRWTEASVPSMFRGQLFPNGVVPEDWIERTKKTSLPFLLSENGYKNYFVGLYQPEIHGEEWDDIATPVLDEEIDINVSLVFHFNAFVHLIDFNILKVFPRSIHKFWDRKRRGPMARLLGIRSWSHLVKEDHLSALGDLKLLHNISKKAPVANYFLFSHLIITHHPFYLSEDCQFKSDYAQQEDLYHYKESQSACATHLLAKVLLELQTKELFKQSLIILISDHGITGNRERVFLAVKPPGQGLAPLQFSPKGRSNTDLFDLVINALKSKDLMGNQFLENGLKNYESQGEVIEVFKTHSLSEIWKIRRLKISFKEKQWMEEIKGLGYLVSDEGTLEFSKE